MEKRKGKSKSTRLSPRVALFVEEYARDLDGAAAYIRAGYSPRGAKQSAHRLLQVPKVQEALQASLAARRERLHLSQDRAVLELANIAFSRYTDFASWGPDGMHLVDSSGLTPEQASAVSEVSMGKDGSIRLKLHPKLDALEMMSRMLGLDKPKEKPDLTWAELMRLADEP